MNMAMNAFMLVVFAVIFAPFAFPLWIARADPPSGPWLVYKTISPNVTSGYVAELAINVFNMTAPVVEFDSGEYFVNSSWPRILRVSNVSGSIWYEDLTKWHNATYVPTELPDALMASYIANSFVSTHASYLRPTTGNLASADIGYVVTRAYDTLTNTTAMDVQNCIQVHYGFATMEGYDVAGPGAKMTVAMGDNGEIIGFYRDWREIESYGYYQAISQIEALNRYIEQSGLGPENLNLTNTKWVYWAETGLIEQDFLQPMWLVKPIVAVTQIGPNGSIEEWQMPSDGQIVPATVFSPQVTITTPTYNSTFSQGQAIVFSASASFGTPPYVYEWTSDGDRLLYRGPNPSFSMTLSADMREGSATQTSIMLTVTDAHGIESLSQTSIRVVAFVGGVQVPIDKTHFVLDWLLQPSTLMAIVISIGLTVVVVAKKKGKVGLLGFVLLVVITSNSLLIATRPVTAAGPNDNGDPWEVCIEWVNDYSGTGQISLTKSSSCAIGFRDRLKNAGWRCRYSWGDSYAFQSDFVPYDIPFPSGMHGSDSRYVDNVDIAYFAGHGWGSSIVFGFWDKAKSLYNFDQDAWFNWLRLGGNERGFSSSETADLEWLALDACETLKWADDYGSDVWTRWGPVFCGLHSVSGFTTTTTDSDSRANRGRIFADSLVQGFSVSWSWIWATCQTAESGAGAAHMWAERSDGILIGTEALPVLGISLNPDPYPVAWLYWMTWTI